jgi:hypothetical protein
MVVAILATMVGTNLAGGEAKAQWPLALAFRAGKTKTMVFLPSGCTHTRLQSLATSPSSIKFITSLVVKSNTSGYNKPQPGDITDSQAPSNK